MQFIKYINTHINTFQNKLLFTNKNNLIQCKKEKIIQFNETKCNVVMYSHEKYYNEIWWSTRFFPLLWAIYGL